MIRSMTAYARREINSTWGSATWELRSVNQRYLETHIRLPDQFRSLEPVIRKRIRYFLTRGKFECNLFFELDPYAISSITINEALAKQLIKAVNWVKTRSGEGEIDLIDMLRWPGVISDIAQNLDAISSELMQALDCALDDFVAVRESEGAILKVLIEQRLNGVSAEVGKIRRQMPSILQWQRERLVSKLEEIQIKIEAPRIEQEFVLMAQRMDIDEELDRLETHIKETHKILQKKEAVGRRLDFMMQELHRESNTLASKSINTDVTASAIELKVLVEQMREQIQNVE
ncbi:YicC/YloC family endoribonuclease [Candidatus Gillettellia adelgis]